MIDQVQGLRTRGVACAIMSDHEGVEKCLLDPAGKLEKLHLQLPTAQKLRSIVEIRATPLDSSSKSLVARALSHSEQTAEHHYRAAQPANRSEAFKVVGQLVGLPTVDPVPATRKRKRFTAEQAAIIRTVFADEIRSRRPQNKATAETFLQTHKND